MRGLFEGGDLALGILVIHRYSLFEFLKRLCLSLRNGILPFWV